MDYIFSFITGLAWAALTISCLANFCLFLSVVFKTQEEKWMEKLVGAEPRTSGTKVLISWAIIIVSLIWIFTE